MNDSRHQLAPGSLLPAILRCSRHALACGAMQPIETEEEYVRDAGIDFLVRRVSGLARKEEDRQRTGRETGPPANPFLPYEPDLFVAGISHSHVALLNKFNVIDHHLLIVTRRFVHQEGLIAGEDFAALAACMAQLDGLGFYNGGVLAGASQAHKHLQLVPLPLGKRGPPVPMETLFEPVRGQPGIVRAPGLAFLHAFSWIEPGWFDDPAAAGARLHGLYRALLAQAGVRALDAGGEARQSAPYNLLLTRSWMLLVPRSREHFDAISINALGFAGSLFVREEAQLQALKRAGPMAALEAVSLPEVATRAQS
ncbi:MAG: phosphorylase [Betaproteobacteria bacterium]|nr:phosphorylase [Betaproteobacteria bacterium]